jgi:selenocysteine lyase/cysteine desulfurase
MPTLDVEAIRADFPALSQSVHGRPLVYLDSAGHLCAQPLLRLLGLSSTVRASLAVYNRALDIDALIAALHKARETLGT